jgi:predicted site-specific integrase-resolvase
VRLRINVIDVSRPSPLLTTAETARLLGIHPRTLTKYVRQGKVKPTMRLPSGQMRWDLDDVRRQLAELDQSEPDDA